ncbi:hydroxyethylthiazole kinase [Microbacterium album]|nr:hydroxyethylthiazole kinase [Microbacterium album]
MGDAYPRTDEDRADAGGTAEAAGPAGVPDAAAVHARLRESAPMVQCVTNAVVTNFTANVLLATGAAPVMADVPGEAGECARLASALLINLGTPSGEQREAMREAAQAARAAGTPWVLDPVGVGSLSLRSAFARELLTFGPAVIRGNASEVLALAGAGRGGRGVDSTDDVEGTGDAAMALSGATGAVVAVSGPVDLITDGARVVRVPGGSPLLTRVTGGGCALGAVVAAAVAAARGLASPDSSLAGAVAAHALYAVSSERAALAADGPGTFAVRFLDEIARVEPAALRGRARAGETGAQ